MTASAIKKQVDDYLPLLTAKQQELVLAMIKTLLQVESNGERISAKEYNKELKKVVVRMESEGGVSHSKALKELSKW